MCIAYERSPRLGVAHLCEEEGLERVLAAERRRDDI